jgi:peptide deformylase
MDIPPLLSDTDPLLARTMPKFDFKTSDAGTLEDLLLAAMEKYGGVGLAANQIGIEANACAVKLGLEEKAQPTVMFNPMMTWLSTDTIMLDEGCLTFDGLFLMVKRPKEAQVTFQDREGVRRVLDLKGWDARIVLHETDHLNGVVFTSRVSKLRLDMAKKKARKGKNNA